MAWATWQIVVLVIVSVLVGVAALWILWKFIDAHIWSKLRRKWSKIGKDVVLLHQFPRGKTCPNLSPFALKVESFMRLANIKYEVETEKQRGQNRIRCPWMTFNGEDFEDSQMIVSILTKHFDIHLDDYLDQKKKANLHALRILAEEHLFWVVCTYRYVHDKCDVFLSTQSFPGFITWGFRTFMPIQMQKKAIHHGIGLYTHEEVYQMGYQACQTISHTLDNDAYFGGEQPCTTDCCMFGQLAQLMWNAPGTRYGALVKDVFPNLGKYCDRMKNLLYPDWNQLLTSPVIE